MSTYYAVGVYRLPRPPGQERASLPFPTLEAALAKVRDWVEADEIDDDEDAPMFSEYVITLTPPPEPPPAREKVQPGMLRLALN